MRAELHLIAQTQRDEQRNTFRLNDVQFGGLLNALITYTMGQPLAGPPDEHELEELRNLLADIQWIKRNVEGL